MLFPFGLLLLDDLLDGIVSLLDPVSPLFEHLLLGLLDLVSEITEEGELLKSGLALEIGRVVVGS